MANYAYGGLRVRVTADTSALDASIRRSAAKAGQDVGKLIAAEVPRYGSRAGRDVGKAIASGVTGAGARAAQTVGSELESRIVATSARVGARVGRALGSLIGKGAEGAALGERIGRQVGTGISAGLGVVRSIAGRVAALIPEPFRNAARSAASVISAGLSAAFTGTRAAASRAAALAGQAFGRALGPAAGAVTSVLGRAFGAVQAVAGRAASAAGAVFGRALGPVAGTVTSTLGRAFANVQAVAGRAASTAGAVFARALAPAGGAVTSALGRAFAAVQSAAGRAAAAAGSVFARAVAPAGSAITSALGRAFAAVQSSAGRAASAASSVFARAAGSAGSAITSALGRAFAAVQSAAGRVGETISSGLSSAGGGVGLLGAIKALPGPVKAAGAAMAVLGVSVIKTGVSYNTLSQTSRAAFKTILGSSEAADKMMTDLAEFARSSPFPRQAFIEGARQMVSFGIEAKKVIPYFTSIQDAVAASGGSAQTLSEITLVMSQIQAAGKITGVDLMQFAQRGINAAELIGLAMGRSAQQIKDEISTGSFDATRALDALAAGMEKRYGGAAANVKTTWAGTTDRIKGAMRDVGSAIVAPFIDPKGGGLAVEWGNTLATSLRQAIPAITAAMTQLSRAIAVVGGWVNRFQGWLLPLAGGIMAVVAAITAYKIVVGAITLVTKIWTAVQAGLNLVLAANPVVLIALAVIGLAAAFYLAWRNSQTFRNVVTGAFNAIKGVALTVWNAVASAVTWAWTTVIRPVWTAIAAYFRVVAIVIVTVWNAILKPVFQLWGTMLTWVWRSIILPIWRAMGPAFAAVGAALAAVWNGAVRPVLMALGAVTAWVWNTLVRPVWNAMRPAFAALGAAIAAVWNGAIRPALMAFGSVVSWVWRSIIQPVFNAIRAAAIALWQSGIKPMVDGSRNLWQQLGLAFNSVWRNVIKPVFDAVRAAALAVASTFASAWNAARAVTTAVWDAMRAIVVSVTTAVTRVVSAAWNVVRAVTAAAWNAVRGTVTAMLTAIRAVVAGVTSAVSRTVTAAWNAVRSVTAAVWNATRAIISDVLDAIRNAVAAAVTWIGNRISASWTFIRNLTASLWNAIRAVLDAAWAAIRNAVQAAVTWIGNRISAAWTFVRNTTTQLWGQVGQAITGAWNTIRARVQEASQWVMDRLRWVWDQIRSTASNAWNGVVNVISDAWNRVRETVAAPVRWVVKEVINKLIRGINALITKISIPAIPEIPGFAQGGRIPGGWGGGDRKVIRAEPGEWVLTKRQARAIGYGNLARLPKYAHGGMVGGGGPMNPQERFPNIGGALRDIGGAFARITHLDDLVNAGKDLVDEFSGMLSWAAAEAFKVLTSPLKAAVDPWTQDPQIFPKQWAGKTVVSIIDAAAEFISGKAMGPCDAGGVVAHAMQFEGKPYRWGGPANPAQGFDCSSFVSYIAGSAGLPLPGGFRVPASSHGPVTTDYLVFGGMTNLPLSSTQPGDIAVNVQHIGFIIGPGGAGFAARSTATGIGKQSFASGYTYRRWTGGGDPTAAGGCATGGGEAGPPGDYPSGVRHYAGLVARIAGQLGVGQWTNVFLSQMQSESGGNPRAINNWDINAQRGDPSRGLMQVIGATFAQYGGPFRNRSIYDPEANIYAAINYARQRYGARIPQVLGHGHGYAEGGIVTEPVIGIGLHSGEPYSIAERGPERISPLRGGANDTRAVAALDRARARGPVINVYPQPGQSERQIAAAVSRELEWAAAGGGS